MVFVTKSCVRVYEFMYGLHSYTGFFLDAMNVFTWIMFFVHSGYWFYLTALDIKRRSSKTLTQEESRCVIYSSALMMYSIWGVISGLIWPSALWQGINEETLASYLVGQVILTVMVTGNHTTAEQSSQESISVTSHAT